MGGSSKSAKKASSLFYAELVQVRVGAEKLSDYLFLLFSSPKNLLSHFNFVFKSGCWLEIKFTPFRVGENEFDFFDLRNQRKFLRFFFTQKSSKSFWFRFLKDSPFTIRNSPFTHYPLTSFHNTILPKLVVYISTIMQFFPSWTHSHILAIQCILFYFIPYFYLICLIYLP